MKHEQFDGYDVELVRERVSAAREYARSGQGPVFLEIMTYRHRGHSMSDPAKYRPSGELEEKKMSDPLLVTEKRLIEDFQLSADELKVLQKEIDTEAKASYQFAENSANPDPKTIYDFVYAD
jgi:pyruvate dehydrogenase E1 component alpha subunit